MDIYINSAKTDESLPVCRIITEHPELYGMIVSVFDGYFRVTEDDNWDLIIKESGQNLILSPGKSSVEEVLERPFTPAALIAVAQDLTAHERHSFSCDEVNRFAMFGDLFVQLTETEFQLYKILLDSGNTPVPAEVLSTSVWGKYDRNLCTVHLSNLRHKLDSVFGDGTLITVSKKGYKLRNSI